MIKKSYAIAYGLRAVMLEAGTAMKDLRSDGDFQPKGPLDIVGTADKLVEGHLTRWVTTSRQDESGTGEEGSMVTSGSGNKKWHFDPVDGTKNFASGLPYFAISAGRDGGDGQPDMGGIYLPETGQCIFAAKGEGVWIWEEEGDLDPTRLELMPFARTLETSVIALGLTEDYWHLFGKFRKVCWNAIMLGSCVYESYKLVVEGKCSAYVHTGPTSFDIAAVAIIAKEAGLAVSSVDLRREKMLPFVIAQNEAILGEILAICQFPEFS